MSDINIEVEGGTSVRLPTKGKWCDRDIIITATGEVPAKPVTITWDGNTEGLPVYNYDYKISDFIPDFDKYSKNASVNDGYYDVTFVEFADGYWYAAVSDMGTMYIYPSDHESGGGIFVPDPSNGLTVTSITFNPAESGGSGDSGGNGYYTYDFVEYDSTIYFDAYDWVKVSDETPDMSVYANGATVEARNEMNMGETETDYYAITSETEFGYWIYAEYAGGTAVAVVNNDSLAGMGITKGVYFKYDQWYYTTTSIKPN